MLLHLGALELMRLSFVLPLPPLKGPSPFLTRQAVYSLVLLGGLGFGPELVLFFPESPGSLLHRCLCSGAYRFCCSASNPLGIKLPVSVCRHLHLPNGITSWRATPPWGQPSMLSLALPLFSLVGLVECASQFCYFLANLGIWLDMIFSASPDLGIYCLLLSVVGPCIWFRDSRTKAIVLDYD